MGGIFAITVFVMFISSNIISESALSDGPVTLTSKNETMNPEKSKSTSESQVMVTNGLNHIIPLDKIRSGGPPKDGIPSIDKPQFVKANEANFISDSDTVIGLEINGDARAYPLFILVWHEIVNDQVGDVPVAVTYCPLCYTNQVFLRIIDDQVAEFGTSGKLYNSNLVMYDRLTNSYWSQALGIAITGEMAGYELDILPFDVIQWGDWKAIHPDSLVLTTDTGYLRSYGVDPYGGYYTDQRVIFPVENKDDRIHPKEIILGFHENGKSKAYRQSDLEKQKFIVDNLDDLSILLISEYSGNARAFDRDFNGQVLDFDYVDGKILDLTTRSEWSYDGLAVSGSLKGNNLSRLPFNPGFWFEWVAFHPETDIYGGN